jgi:hypothetical protein
VTTVTDLRARLAGALRQLDYNEMMYGDKKNYEARADVLLELDGITIVETQVLQEEMRAAVESAIAVVAGSVET